MIGLALVLDSQSWSSANRGTCHCETPVNFLKNENSTSSCSSKMLCSYLVYHSAINPLMVSEIDLASVANLD